MIWSSSFEQNYLGGQILYKSVDSAKNGAIAIFTQKTFVWTRSKMLL